ncbi:MAG: acyl--CoA ligase [Actinobacteria bacterium]|nr:acyl--CoA ligase [Actinomycetota bacterium]
MDLGWITRSPHAQLPLGDPDAIALSFEREHQLTYRELLDRQTQLANGLLALGVEPGDRVGILMRNNAEYLPLHFAIARIGAISVRLNFRLTAPEIEFALKDSGCRVVCSEPDFLERLEKIAGPIPAETIVIFGEAVGTSLDLIPSSDLYQHGNADPDLPTPVGADPLMLMYTSGTTGFPKAAVWTHDTAIGCAVSQALEFGFGPDTVAMSTGPLYHAAAFEVLLLPAMLMHGSAVFMSSGQFSVERMVEIAAANRVTDIMIFPFMVYDLLRLEHVDRNLMPAMRRILTGGDPIAPWALEAAAERFPDIEIVQGYGLTEATQSTLLPGDLAAKHPGSIGRPFPLKEVKVVDEAGADAAEGEVGEVWIRGHGVTTEYWQRPEETAATYTEGGWLHTGDVGQVTNGLLSLAGRKKDMIRSGAENISPAEVEAALTTSPEIEDAAVIAIPDARYTEVGCALVVLADGVELDPEALDAYCRERLAAYKCPKRYVAIADLPRNASGKVLKAQLREEYRHLGSTPGIPQSA